VLGEKCDVQLFRSPRLGKEKQTALRFRFPTALTQRHVWKPHEPIVDDRGIARKIQCIAQLVQCSCERLKPDSKLVRGNVCQ
jgi:hypothetical protein